MIVDPIRNVHFVNSDLEQVWSRAQPAELGGMQVLTLSPVDLLRHLCLHASIQHRLSTRLRSYWDIALVIQKYGDVIDWTQFSAGSNQAGAANGVRLALQLTEEWTGVVIPSSAWAALKATSLDDATLNWMRHRILKGSSHALMSNVVHVEARSLVVDKLRALRAALFPSRAQMARKYRAPADSWRILLCYPVRWKSLWIGFSQTMWQILLRDQKLIMETRHEAHLHAYLSGNCFGM